jgi:phage terminase large subunit-like protein
METSFDALLGFSHDALKAEARAAAERDLWKLERQAKIIRARTDQIDFAELVMPDKRFPENPNLSRYSAKLHHRAIAKALERIERRELQFVILCAPPRHGKSQLTTVNLPTHLLGVDPYANIIVGCYNDILAKGFGRKIRQIVESEVYHEIFPDVTLVKGGRAVDHMATAQDGMIACVGRGGTTTGRGADYFIVDDPFKDRREARSLTMRNEVWDWYQDVVSTRLMSDTGCIILMMTRWHEDDIIGRLTDPDNPHYNEEEAARWTIINLPALAEEDDPLGRAPGESLWPERFGRAYLESFRRKNPVGFAALYQQRPTPEDGEYFKSDMFVTYASPKDLPKRLRMFAASDHAVKSKQKNDKTCIIIAGVCERGLVWIVDIIWKRIDTLRQVDEMIAAQRKHRPVRWWARKDQITGSIGPFLYREMRKERVFIPMQEFPDTEDKVQKAQPFIALMAQRQVRWPAFLANYQSAKTELLKFDNGANDDVVDACANLGKGLERVIKASAPRQVEKEYPTNTFGWIINAARREANDNRRISVLRTG